MYFSNYLFDAVRPTLPNTIDIGAIHCRKARYVKMNETFTFCDRPIRRLFRALDKS